MNNSTMATHNSENTTTNADPTAGSLQLDPTTGRVCAEDSLDACPLYVLEVQAKDGGFPSQESNVVTVYARSALYNKVACTPKVADSNVSNLTTANWGSTLGGRSSMQDNSTTPVWVLVIIPILLCFLVAMVSLCLIYWQQKQSRGSNTLLELSTFKSQSSIVNQSGVQYNVPNDAAGNNDVDSPSKQPPSQVHDSPLTTAATESTVSQAGVDYAVPLGDTNTSGESLYATNNDNAAASDSTYDVASGRHRDDAPPNHDTSTPTVLHRSDSAEVEAARVAHTLRMGDLDRARATEVLLNDSGDVGSYLVRHNSTSTRTIVSTLTEPGVARHFGT